jgi:UDP-perosamine 4-acetyltransferase
MQIIGLGAGGHVKAVVEILRSCGGHEIVGLLDPNRQLWGTGIAGASVLGDDQLMPELYAQGIRGAFIGVGGVGDTAPRRRLYEEACRQGFEVVSAIHPQAVVSPSVRIGKGATIMAGAVINAEARLGDNVIVNTGAIIEHDCMVESHAHIATGARLAGGVHVGEGAHVGLGASVRQGVRIGRNAVVGMGAVVLEDVPDEVVVAGVPARVLRGVGA